MTDASNLFLGVIAFAVLMMAVLQLGAVIMLARHAKRVMSLTEELQREIKPLAAKVHTIADEAQRAAALATHQVERVDALVTDVSRRVQETTASLQAIVTGPVRQGTALFAGLRGVLAALLTTKAERRFERDEEEDALFVG